MRGNLDLPDQRSKCEGARRRPTPSQPPCMCTLWEKLGVRTTPEIIHVQQRQTHTSETDSAEGGGVRSEGFRVRILAFCGRSSRKKYVRSTSSRVRIWSLVSFFRAVQSKFHQSLFVRITTSNRPDGQIHEKAGSLCGQRICKKPSQQPIFAVRFSNG